MKTRDIHFYAKPFCIALGWSGLSIAGPVQVDRLGASISFIGFVAASGALTYTLAAAVSGRLSDRFGCKRVSVAGSFFAAVFLCGMALARTRWEFFAYNAAAGLANGFFWPPFHHWTGARRDGAPLYRRLQSLCVSLAIGRFLGPVVAGFFFERLGPRTPFFLTAGLSFLVALSLSSETPPDQPEDAAKPVFDPDVAASRKSGFLVASWLGVFVSMFSVVSFNALFPKLGESQLGMSPELIGKTLTASLVVMPLSLFWLGRHNNWHYRWGFMIFCHLINVVGLALMFFVREPIGVFFAFAAITMCFSGFYFSSLYYSLARGAGQGQASGVHEALIGSGALLGPLLGGFVAGPFGLRAPYMVCLVCVALIAAAQLAVARSSRQAEGLALESAALQSPGFDLPS